MYKSCFQKAHKMAFDARKFFFNESFPELLYRHNAEILSLKLPLCTINLQCCFLGECRLPLFNQLIQLLLA